MLVLIVFFLVVMPALLYAAGWGVSYGLAKAPQRRRTPATLPNGAPSGKTPVSAP